MFPMNHVKIEIAVISTWHFDVIDVGQSGSCLEMAWLKSTKKKEPFDTL